MPPRASLFVALDLSFRTRILRFGAAVLPASDGVAARDRYCACFSAVISAATRAAR